MTLKTVAWISGVYDLALALGMLFCARPLAALFGAPPPVPVVNAQLNGVFTLALAVGYFWAARDVEARRGFLWVAGVLAKGLGAALFVVDHLREGSPASFLLFAASDGALALLTLALLLRAPAAARVSTPEPRPASGTPRD
ncbi:MAG TPA: hypothetical protein VF310_07690 [Vicinamibacteria bacterium]